MGCLDQSLTIGDAVVWVVAGAVLALLGHWLKNSS